MTLVEETNKDAIATYSKLIFVEFLEFLGRIADVYFSDSELKNLDLY